MNRPTLIISPFSARESESHGVYADSEANPAWTTGTFDFCLSEAEKFANGDHALDGQREYKDARILIRCATGTIEVTDIGAACGRYIAEREEIAERDAYTPNSEHAGIHHITRKD